MTSKPLAGIILCGGRSTRMGQPKALLPFGSETLLERIAGILRECCGEMVVVAATGQSLPPLPADVQIVHDRQSGVGPLEGLRAGLYAIAADRGYVTGCDAPLLTPAFIGRVDEMLGSHQAAVPLVEGHFQPLAAVYRRDLLLTIDRLLAGRRRSLVELLEAVDCRAITAGELLGVDPGLKSLRHPNTPAAYLAALAEAGLPVPAGLFASSQTDT